MPEYKNIQDIQNALTNLLLKGQDPGGFADKIDKFDIDEVTSSISNYWNKSVYDLYNTLKNIIPKENWDNTNEDGHDAGYSFQRSPYVNPNENEIGETFLNARKDEINSVLKNENNLDFTIGDYLELTAEIKKYMTRLIMPQYERRTEVEDLNRNFWVIGQNLTALNKVVLELGDDFINQLIGELTGLWDNIYRIWQALLSLENIISSLRANEKIRFMMEYGYGNYNTGSIAFTKDNAFNYGILPYISKQVIKDGDTKYYIYYVQYNKRITDKNINLDQQELLNGFNRDSKGRGLIKMDCKETTRDIKNMLKTIRQRNFVLVGKSSDDVFSQLTTCKNPLLNVLDFYRDYLYFVTNADKGNPLSTLIKVTSVWKQSGYLQYIDFIQNDGTNFKDDSVISENIINSFKYIKVLFGLDLDFVNKTAALTYGSKISDLRDKITATIDILVKDLYTIYIRCQQQIGLSPTNSYDNQDGANIYSVYTGEDTFTKTFVNMLRQYEQDNSLDGNGLYQSILGNLALPYVNWDLLSMSTIRIGSPLNINFGRDYMYPYNINPKEDHMWVDFVSNIVIDGIRNTRSTIGTYTENDLKDSNYQVDEKDLYYDFNITIPLNKAKGSNGTVMPKYIDFVRIGKPYPNITKITDNAATASNGLNDIDHINSLNEMDNWIGFDDASGANYSFCVDGFYSFDQKYCFYSDINSENMVKKNDYEIYKLQNLLTFHIASSDMIDCTHTEDGSGQTRKDNRHNFEDPVVNLRFINGRTKSQEIEIIITKDSTDTPKKPTPDIPIITELTSCEVVKIGDVYPDRSFAKDYNNYRPAEPGNEPGYSTGTYGKGSYYIPLDEDKYHLPNSEDSSEDNRISCKFVSYEDFDKGQITQYTKSELNQQKVREIGEKYIKKLYKGTTKPVLVVTKMGLEYWTGNSGSQWQGGQVADLFFVSPTESDEPEVRHLSFLGKFDGYWGDIDGDGSEDVFSKREDGSRWRHLDIRAQKITQKVTKEQTIITGNGFITWYDRNKLGSSSDSDIKNNINPEAEKRGEWSKNNAEQQERVVGYGDFEITNNNFKVKSPEYYRKIGDTEFTSTTTPKIFNSYVIKERWNGYGYWEFI